MKSYAFFIISALISITFDSRLSLAFEVEPSIAVLARKYSNSKWNLVDDRSDLKMNVTMDRIQARIFRKVGSLYAAFTKLERPLLSMRFDDVEDVFAETTRSRSHDISKLLDHMRDIDYNFEQLVEYSVENENVSAEDGTVDVHTLIDFSKTVTSHQTTSVKNIMKKIHDVVAPATRYMSSGLFWWLAISRNIHDKLSRIIHQSPQQWLYNFFNKIALAQMKGYVTMQYSYIMLEMYNQGTFAKESRIAKYNFQYRMKTMLKEIKRALAIVSKEYWRRDPEEFKLDENYWEITRLLQGYLVNERVLNKGGRCFGRCNAFQETNIANCQNDGYCRIQRQCGGNVYDCHAMEGMDMNVCPGSYDSTRRYEYIQYEDNTVLGRKSQCSVSTATLSGWIGWCPYCMCFCEDEGYYSDRYISLKRAISDTATNKVVTGVRFVKNNRIIHLQVQQGELLPYGLINDTTVEWVPVNNFKLTDRYVHDKTEYFKLGKKRNAIDLHVKEVEGENKGYPKRVITGLRFSILKTQTSMHLNLEIRETAFDFNTGKLFLTSHQWTRNTQTKFSKDRRTQVHIHNVDLPTRSTAENTVRSHGVQYLEFTQTSVEKDAAQTTIPFIDAQEVAPSVATPLIGAGVYYKAAEGYGGFIGLKIVTYDFTEHL